MGHQGRAKISECTKKPWWITRKKRKWFSRKCPVPACVAVATFCSLNVVKAHAIPDGQFCCPSIGMPHVGEYTQELVSPQLSPHRYLWEHFDDMCGRDLNSRKLSRNYLGKERAVNSAKAAQTFGRCEHNLAYCDFQFSAIWQFKINETTWDPVRTRFQMPRSERTKVSLMYLICQEQRSVQRVEWSSQTASRKNNVMWCPGWNLGIRKRILRDFPAGPGAKIPYSQLQRPKVESLVRELDPICYN